MPCFSVFLKKSTLILFTGRIKSTSHFTFGNIGFGKKKSQKNEGEEVNQIFGIEDSTLQTFEMSRQIEHIEQLRQPTRRGRRGRLRSLASPPRRGLRPIQGDLQAAQGLPRGPGPQGRGCGDHRFAAALALPPGHPCLRGGQRLLSAKAHDLVPGRESGASQRGQRAPAD